MILEATRVDGGEAASKRPRQVRHGAAPARRRTAASRQRVTPGHHAAAPPAFALASPSAALSPIPAAVRRMHRAVNYGLEDVDQQPAELLRLAKAHLAAGVPFAFDFPLYRSIAKAQRTGRIPLPLTDEPILTNHAVVAVGYDDQLEIGAGVEGAVPTRGALLIKNSWSEQWGEAGFGWLPYEFVLQGRTRDFWTLLRNA